MDQSATTSEKQRQQGAADSQNEDGNQSSANTSPNEQRPPPTWLAWTVRGVSLAMVLGLLGYFVYLAVVPEEQPTFEFTVQTADVERRGAGWAVPVKVVNAGTLSVHALRLEATLAGIDDSPVEEQIVPLLGPGEEITVEFWFDRDPRPTGVACSTGSYLLP